MSEKKEAEIHFLLFLFQGSFACRLSFFSSVTGGSLLEIHNSFYYYFIFISFFFFFRRKMHVRAFFSVASAVSHPADVINFNNTLLPFNNV